jgi:hypothetical protein
MTTATTPCALTTYTALIDPDASTPPELAIGIGG